MPIPITRVQPDEKLPARADVVIIGGGIAGVCTALFLARKGISVAICEKGEIGAEQSGRNWGWCRTLGRDPAEIPLSMESLRLWRGMNAMIEGETGFRLRHSPATPVTRTVLLTRDIIKMFDGLIVADLSRVLAGPYCSMLLADLGATVIKVESPAGDETRTWRPPEKDGTSTYYLSINRNKRSIVLDFTRPEDVAVVHELLRRADVAVENFKLSLKVKLTPNKENSGIQFRSVPLPDGEMRGPQADIGAGWWGKLYEESGRGILAKAGGEQFVKADGWNDYVVEAVGARVRIWINGSLCTDYEDDKLARRGIIGLQLHSGGPLEVRFKDVKLEVLK